MLNTMLMPMPMGMPMGTPMGTPMYKYQNYWPEVDWEDLNIL
jgi:hypothetical protein